jgi:hypothetical protein
VDNLIRCHPGCHKQWDEHQIVLDPQRRVWWNPRNIAPPMIRQDQYGNLLTGDNIQKRLVMIKKKWQCTTDAAFYAKMEERGYHNKNICV